ncbi:MAG TPA: DoxX family membrane protein, partial [Tenuifilaceae bacterium]|nr:DoxX family membrane protein [Tenuifilaceae bacterium]HRX68721.1 DoxX family membrane protein [Tenuifilaceae bacterium]
MKTTKNTYEQSERIIAYWLNRNSLYLLRISIGIIFLWFGFLKFFPGLSPAQDLAIDTIAALTFGLVTPKFIIITLATWETVIGLGFLTGKFQRIT